jgi:hypothetical protein
MMEYFTTGLRTEVISLGMSECPQARMRKRGPKTGMFSAAPGDRGAYTVAAIPVTGAGIDLF